MGGFIGGQTDRKLTSWILLALVSYMQLRTVPKTFITKTKLEHGVLENGEEGYSQLGIPGTAESGRYGSKRNECNSVTPKTIEF